MANAQRGFTLLEMLVVIVLISVAAGLVGFGLQQGLRAAKAVSPSWKCSP